MRVNVGDVVVSKYTNFEGELKRGLFVVVSHDCVDNPLSNNFTALKVSSKPYLYQTKLEKKYLPFLDHDSWVNSNNMFRIREDNVQSIIGRITMYYKNKILRQMINYHDRTVDQMVDSIGDGNLFEDTI